MSKKRIFIIAGEESGDKIGALVMKRLDELSACEYRGIGGKAMQNLGLESLFPIENISLMGFFEILPHIFKLKRLINLTIDSIIEYEPDIIITIDSPGFTYRVVESVKSKIYAGISGSESRYKKSDNIESWNPKFVHIVAPSVWAYKPERAKKYADIYDLLLTLLPFEAPLFQREGLQSLFIGHFAFEDDLCNDKKFFRQKYNIPVSHKLISMTPGSRACEVARHLPVFLDAIDTLKKKLSERKVDIVLVIVASSQKILSQIESHLLKRRDLYSIGTVDNNKLLNVIVTLEDKFAIYKGSDLVLAKSGTNNIEISLHKTPQIIAYKVSFLSWLYIKSKLLIKFANLINIMAKKEIIPEFIQDKCTSENLALAMEKLLINNEESTKQINDSQPIINSMRNIRGDPSVLAAEEILNLLS